MSLLAGCLRLPRLAAALLAAVPLLAATARAEQVTIHLEGKVSVLSHIGNPNAELQLAAKGVTAGTPAMLELVIESTTPGVLVDFGSADYTQYDMAIVDVKVTAGTRQERQEARRLQADHGAREVAREAGQDGGRGTRQGEHAGRLLFGPGAAAMSAELKPFVNAFVDLTVTGVE